jgi:hypothetical protein
LHLLTCSLLSIGTLILVLLQMATGRSLPIRSVLPFAAVFVIWIIAFFVRRSRGQAKLRTEIDELKGLEKVGPR